MAVDAILDEVDEWAARRGQRVDREDMRTVLELSRDYLEHDDPTRFVPGDLDELLFDAYPQAVVLETEAEAADVVRTVRDLLDFLGDTNRLPAEQLQALTEELDGAGPEFVQATVDGWPDGDEDSPLRRLLAMLGMPTDRLPAMRLPGEAELVAAARNSLILAQAKDFAVGETVTSPEDARFVAEAVEFVLPSDDGLAPGPGLDSWAGTDDDFLADLWMPALTALVHHPDVAADGLVVFMVLFLLRGRGVPLDEMGTVVESSTVDDWGPWTGRLVDHNALTVRDGIVRLTPLAQALMRDQLVADGVEIDLLPPPDEMTAEDLASLAGSYSDEEMADELSAWLVSRDVPDAARELLAVAAEGNAVERLWATSAVVDLGGVVEPVWRAALEDDVLRPYAKLALKVADPTMSERGWIAVDSITVAMISGDLGQVLASIEAFLPAGAEEDLLDAMWRLPHPDALEVLEVVGEYHPDKKIAKLARRAAHRAASRLG
jgi:hypothetical protein